jgi:hypothetical protein
MPKKRKNGDKHNGDTDSSDGLWISEKHSLRGPGGNRAWDHRPGGLPTGGKFLELADVALGLKKLEPKKRRTGARGIHVIVHKTEPYSQ